MCVLCEANPCEACVVLMIGAAHPDQLITAPSGSTWIYHMTGLADTQKEESLYVQTLTLCLY